MGLLEDLDPQTALVSNSPEAVMLFTGRSAHPLLPQEKVNSESADSVSGISAFQLDELICQADRQLLVLLLSRQVLI